VNKTINVYADSAADLGKIADRLMKHYGATGWNRQENVMQGAGAYTITLKNVPESK
jgi:hypothetical protein